MTSVPSSYPFLTHTHTTLNIASIPINITLSMVISILSCFLSSPSSLSINISSLSHHTLLASIPCNTPSAHHIIHPPKVPHHVKKPCTLLAAYQQNSLSRPHSLLHHTHNTAFFVPFPQRVLSVNKEAVQGCDWAVVQQCVITIIYS